MTDHAAAVAQARSLTDERAAAAERERQLVIAAVKDWYPGWVKATTAARVKANYARVQELGEDRVAPVRARVKALRVKADDVINEHLGQDDIGVWPHVAGVDGALPSGLLQSVSVGGPAPISGSGVDRQLARAMGELGVILIEGQIEEDRWESGVHGVWQSRTVGGRREITAWHTQDLPSEVREVIAGHARAAGAYLLARRDLAQAVKARDEDAATDLWGDD